MTEINDPLRIRVIRAITGLDKKAFRARLGISVNTLTWWEMGRSSPSGAKKKALEELCAEYGIGFLPCGYPAPLFDCMTYKTQEEKNGGSGSQRAV